MQPWWRSFLFGALLVGVFFAFRYPPEPTFTKPSQGLADVSSAMSSSSATTSAITLDEGSVAAVGDPSQGNATSATLLESASAPSAFTASGSGALPFARVKTVLPPNLDYKEALIGDVLSGTVIMKDASSGRWPMASITKLMNATVAMDNLSPTQSVTITPSMFAVDPSEKTLVLGGTYSVSDLMRVMLLPSSNVAAEALAETYGRTRFIDAMNARAMAWGMAHTYYDDPCGLSAANQSTANDLLLLTQHVYAEYPQVLTMTNTPRTTITELNSSMQVVVKSINLFAGLSNFVGGKTGYTDEASGNLLSVFSYENRPIVVIVLGTPETDRFTITQSLYNWFVNSYK